MIVDEVLKNERLQRVFSFPGDSVRIYGKDHLCLNVKDWGRHMRKNGAWGDNSVVQIFADITGISVHVVPTDRPDVEGVITNYRPDENPMDDAAITIVHGNSHFQIAVPTKLPSSVVVTLKESPEIAPTITVVDNSKQEERIPPPRRKWERFTRQSQRSRKRKVSSLQGNNPSNSSDSDDDVPLSARLGQLKKNKEGVDMLNERHVKENNEPKVMAESKKQVNGFRAEKVKSMDISNDIDHVENEEFCDIKENTITSNDENNNDDHNVNDCKTVVSKPRSKGRDCRCLPDWFEQVDENNDKIGSYLRPVEGSLSQVYCTVDNSTFSVRARGFAAIRDHIKSKKHIAGVAGSVMHSSSGSYFLKNSPTEERKRRALMKILIFCNSHGLSLSNVSHLLKTCQEAFPDSLIAKGIKMGRESATYHLRNGLAKTVAEKLYDQLRTSPFSLSFDAGTKGKHKRTEVIVRLWSDESDIESVIERSLFVLSSNHETAAAVAGSIISRCEDAGINLSEQLIMANTDSSSVMRGKKAGAVKLLSKTAPQVLQCDIGGDGLHHVHNAEKSAFKEVFPEVIKFVDNVKYDITCSPAKLETYLECCEKVGDRKTMPVSYCISRFLDRYEAVRDRLEHIDTLEEYYSNASVPRSRGNMAKHHPEKKSRTSKDIHAEESDIEVSEDTEEDEDENGDLRGNPRGRVNYMKRVLSTQKILSTEFHLLLSYCCLKPGHKFLLIFQGKSVKIHLLYDAFEKLLKEVLLEICEPVSLKDSRGADLSGKELKCLVLENKEERQLRRSTGRREVQRTVRYGRLVDESACLLGKEILEGINLLSEKYNLSREKKEELVIEAKAKSFQFQLKLAKQFQHYLPLDVDFLRWLKYLCPRKFLKNEESEACFVKIAECFPSIKTEELDDLRREVRKVKNFKNQFFDELLEEYLDSAHDAFQKSDKKDIVSIDKVWRPVLKNEETPVMKKFLMSALSIFHGTASVEGSVNVTRNLLGDKSHSLIDVNLEAKKVVMSAVQEAKSSCCFDFNVDHKSFHSDWIKAYSLMRKTHKEEEDDDPSEDIIEDKAEREIKGLSNREDVTLTEGSKKVYKSCSLDKSSPVIDKSTNLAEPRGKKKKKDSTPEHRQPKLTNFFINMSDTLKNKQ